MEVGNYVRTDKGTIDKLTKENIMTYEVALMGFGEKPIKSSPNIIDLIEVGDYVNGEKVVNIMKKHEYLEVGDEEITIDKDDIKSIVTKEMFSSVEYRVEND